jgi:aspartyl-tRNA(Asn)/glutamyl-tRNA(Gln) amidotransferase subunit A
MDDSQTATDEALEAIAAANGEGARTFTRVYAESARLEAAAADYRQQQGRALSPLDGAIVSVKDLFDIQGQTTCAGSLVLRDAPPALTDAPAVAQLRRAGAVIIGKTNMTEFAYSGIGLNPHFGTPANPYQRTTLRRVPGGSSSGAAVSVSDGMAQIGLGTDTGGSVRIPAAFCGLVGWKPTARRVSLDGVWPLAPSFDSVGVIARSVLACADADAALTGAAPRATEGSIGDLQLGRLRGYVESGLEPAVLSAYERAIQRLVEAGVEVTDVNCPDLERMLRDKPGVIMTTYEAYRIHAALLNRAADQYDPRVRMRLELGRGITIDQYLNAGAVRKELQQAAAMALRSFDAWILPTVAILPPPFTALDSDERYVAINATTLRNTSLINFLDGCAISLPCQQRGQPPVGFSIAGLGVRDMEVLSIAQALAPVIDGASH